MMFFRAAKGKPSYSTKKSSFKHVKKKHWYYDGGIWAYENGIEKGSNGKFKASTHCTRACVLTYLYRFITGEEQAK